MTKRSLVFPLTTTNPGPGPLGHTLGVTITQAQGHTIIDVPAMPQLGYGSTTPILAVCPKCKTHAREPWAHPILTELYRRSGGDGDVFGSLHLCHACEVAA